MTGNDAARRAALAAGGLGTLLLAGLVLITGAPESRGGGFFDWCCPHRCGGPACPRGEGPAVGEAGGPWYSLGSPEEQQRVGRDLFNRHCIRCHGPAGKGAWDIPNVPDFTNPAWQASRPDDHIATIILEGRGAVMPPFRGTLRVDEALAIARHLRTLERGAEQSRPDLKSPEKPAAGDQLPPPKKPPTSQTP
jgi:hypothetical protein